MLRFTPWLVLAFVLVVSTQPVQARSILSTAAVNHQKAASDDVIAPIQQSPTQTPAAAEAGAAEPITLTIFSQGANAVTITLPITGSEALTATPTTAAPTAPPPTAPPPTAPPPTPITVELPVPTATPEATSAPEPAAPIEGTIIANRTEVLVRFFLEGQTYDLAPLRAQGFALQRDATVLNLFNCDANTPQTQEGCFWDPYLLNRDGFYEIVSGKEAGKAVNLVLQEAGAPPVNQIWVQNRTSDTEVVFYNDQEYDLAPTTVQEFTGQAGVPITLHVRSCLEVADKTVCEWHPQSVDTGIYYALKEMDTNGSVPGSRLHLVQLEPLVGAAQTGSTIVETPAQFTCTLLVPALNVRTGPGLEYAISAKVRGTETEPGSVLVTGRDATGQWLSVDERVAPGGWIISSPDFVNCAGDISALPEAEITDGRLAAQPTAPAAPADAEAAPAPAAEGEAAPAEAITNTAPIATTIPDGQALLIVNNGFDQTVRFTLDQQYRVEDGPSEYDLEPGQSISIFVFPGQVAFSASSAWRGLSGNADFLIESKESRTLWLTFTPDPDGSGRWNLQY